MIKLLVAVLALLVTAQGFASEPFPSKIKLGIVYSAKESRIPFKIAKMDVLESWGAFEKISSVNISYQVDIKNKIEIFSLTLVQNDVALDSMDFKIIEKKTNESGETTFKAVPAVNTKNIVRLVIRSQADTWTGSVVRKDTISAMPDGSLTMTGQPILVQ